MKPSEFSWTEDQQVTVTNPTSETFKFKVHNKEYAIGAGKTARMPGYIAWVYVYGIAHQLCQADKQAMRWNEEGFRKEYYDKVTVGSEPVVEMVAVEEKSPIETLDDEPENAVDTEEGDEPDTAPPKEPDTVDASKVAPMKAKSRERSTSHA